VPEDFLDDNPTDTWESALEPTLLCLKGDLFRPATLFFALGFASVLFPEIGFLDKSNLPCGALTLEILGSLFLKTGSRSVLVTLGAV
jgi:hypothetical protein